MNQHALIETARAMVADDKGLLGMDESNDSCNKRFASAGIAQTVEMRRAWRELLLTAPGLGESISGVSDSGPGVAAPGGLWIPSRGCVEANAHALARYAGLCPEAGLCPSSSPNRCNRAAVKGEYHAAMETA